jgi:hypothetical protein
MHIPSWTFRALALNQHTGCCAVMMGVVTHIPDLLLQNPIHEHEDVLGSGLPGHEEHVTALGPEGGFCHELEFCPGSCLDYSTPCVMYCPVWSAKGFLKPDSHHAPLVTALKQFNTYFTTVTTHKTGNNDTLYN